METGSGSGGLVEIYHNVGHSTNVQLFGNNVHFKKRTAFGSALVDSRVDSTLHWATRIGNQEAVTRLLDGGADKSNMVKVAEKNSAKLAGRRRQVSAYAIATKFGHTDIAVVLRCAAQLSADADVNERFVDHYHDNYDDYSQYGTDYDDSDKYDDYHGTYHGYEQNSEFVDLSNPY